MFSRKLMSQCDDFQYFKRTTMKENQKKVKTQLWSSVVTVVLVEGKNLLAMDDNGFSDPYVKFKLGNEKYKSKVRGIIHQVQTGQQKLYG